MDLSALKRSVNYLMPNNHRCILEKTMLLGGLDTFMINQERLLNEFLELVQIDSETKFEAEIAKVLKQKFTDLGVDVFEDDTTAITGHGAGNLICTLNWNKRGCRSDLFYFPYGYRCSWQRCKTIN